MKYFRLILLLYISLISFSGCRPKTLSPKDYVSYVTNPKHKLLQEKAIANYIISVQYKPLDFVTLIEYRRQTGVVQSFDSIRSQMDSLQQYTVKIKPKKGNTSLIKSGAGSAEEIFNRIEYLSFDMIKDFYILENGDTNKCKIFHFERTYDLNPELTFLLGFEVNKNKSQINDRTFIYEDKVFGLGKIKFLFPSDAIKNIPDIKF
jgi:hypothetical protein